MTDQTDRLAAIRARLEAATPAPWEPRQMSNDDADDPNGYWWVWRGENGPYYNGVAQCLIDDGDVTQQEGSDADFIAHSRGDVPYLLDLVASLTAERDALGKALAWLVGKDWPDHDGDTETERAQEAVILRQGAELHRLRACRRGSAGEDIGYC